MQFALAEAASGEFLLRQLGGRGPQEQTFAVLRTSTVKFRKPAPPGFGQLRASARFAETDAAHVSAALASRGLRPRAVAILVEVTDAHGVVTMIGRFDWFLHQPPPDVLPGPA